MIGRIRRYRHTVWRMDFQKVAQRVRCCCQIEHMRGVKSGSLAVRPRAFAPGVARLFERAAHPLHGKAFLRLVRFG
ncbi:hypothetical protein L3V59_21055 [Burkholderia aenigmatica]|uniref:hypothetical protein n=1 Tax=Burkholderia aenigmatica TaxID=2015348 RepID=UPI001F1C5833|nr:hypothetical protein [Burkholderia aenigmatica]UKD15439.1 hypothetical protein L3V59_21055 [Burkholderia aenigmatica]